MKIAIASDHAGFTYKEQIKVLLRSLGHQVRDFGTSLDTARWSREHNDANVLAIGQRTIPAELALEIVRVWMTMAFAGGRHAARVNSIER